MKMKEIHRSFTLSSQNGANFAGEKTKTRSLKEINSIYYITMSYLRFTKMFLLILACVMGGLSANAQKTVEDLINQEATGVTEPTYKDVTVTGTSGAVYAINCAGQYQNTVQLRWDTRKKKYSGIVTTTTGGKAKKVTVVWDSNTAKTSPRALNIYGSKNKYTDYNDLVDEQKAGTLLGSIKYDENAPTNSFEIEGDFAFIGLRSNSGAVFLTSITIEWEQAGGATQEVTVNLAEGFGTLYNANALTVPAGASCGIVTGVKNGVLDVDYKYAAGQNVPAKTPVLVKAPGKESVTFTTTTSTETAPTTNLLKGADKDGVFATEAGYIYYKLAYNNFAEKKNLGFYWGAAEGGAFKMKAGKAYLAVKQDVAQGAQKFNLEGNATGIEAVEQANEANRVVYTLDGRRVMNEKLANPTLTLQRKISLFSMFFVSETADNQFCVCR